MIQGLKSSIFMGFGAADQLYSSFETIFLSSQLTLK